MYISVLLNEYCMFVADVSPYACNEILRRSTYFIYAWECTENDAVRKRMGFRLAQAHFVQDLNIWHICLTRVFWA
jgi:hypothetical protein